jgi:hypothetical protein
MKYSTYFLKILLAGLFLWCTGEVNAQSWNQTGPDFDGDAAGDVAGHSVSTNADGTVIAYGAHDHANGTGRVKVYAFNGSAWVQRGNDIDGEATGDQSGYSVSLSADGNTIAVGAPNNDGTGTDAGHTRVYVYSAGTWNQTGLDIDGEAAGDQAGSSVDLSADGLTLAVGAPRNAGTGADAGHTRVYAFNAGSWNQVGTDIDGEAAGDQAGTSVSIDALGNAVAIGAPGNDGAGADAGHTRVYFFNVSFWLQLGTDIDGEAAGDNAGHSVSISANGINVAVGALFNDGAGTDAGHARVYNFNVVWNQVGADIDGTAAGDFSGWSVSLSGDALTVAIGAPVHSSSTGQVRVFKFSATWTQSGSDIDGEASGDNAGVGVDISSDASTVSVGAFNNDGAGTDAGHTRVFVFTQPFTTNLRVEDCNITLTSMSQYVYADAVAGADAYRFRFNDGFNTHYYMRTDGVRKFKPSWVNGLLHNTNYAVDVKARVSGVWSDYGAICGLGTPVLSQTTQLTTTYCNTAQSVGTYIYCDAVAGATKYQFRYIEQAQPTNVNVKLMNTNKLKSIWVPNITNTVYDVEVRAKVNGVWTAYGNMCSLTISGAPMAPPPTQSLRDMAVEKGNDWEPIFYPNPTTGLLTLELSEYPQHAIQLQVLNNLGQVVINKQLNGQQLYQFDLSNFDAGLYHVRMLSNNKVITRKVMKQ